MTGTIADLPRVIDFVECACEQAEVDPTARFDLQLAVEEACCNVLEHAYGGEGGEFSVRFATHGRDVVITVQDHGQPFDPDAIIPPDVSIPLEDRPIGGLGLFLMQQVMDDVRFTFSEAGNKLEMVKRGVRTETE